MAERSVISYLRELLTKIDTLLTISATLEERFTTLDTLLESTVGLDPEHDEPCACGSTEHQAASGVGVCAAALMTTASLYEVPIHVNFDYSDADPYAVRMTMSASQLTDAGRMVSDSQTWAYARDILQGAVTSPGTATGAGDVTVQYYPNGRAVQVVIKNDEGSTVVEIDAEPVVSFLTASYGLVPAGEESSFIDDGDLTALIDGTWEA